MFLIELPRPSGRGYNNNNKYAFSRKTFLAKASSFVLFTHDLKVVAIHKDKKTLFISY